ncbi:RluA family pseudouridine synthase [Salegentibacter salegens]|uniref:tRNA pseudouridine65 synthase/23S rRNA pseudouridine1911/1915/1917 synthase n=1 Tax=Salegentibacter salegens TaxID=143223 RepID=A0A1M7LUQ4_9FLAO|nr:RluA family pseudouridine synthase [Salegentibacter salegens]PRX52168.1 tRNA pseudouridine65 synthase [Salegentibacter salegens]SHM81951.1 tRNA pseudouridine65 synthase/23S rRNA pseudouridine1911/1915/1917 synthase [Salegentibacter salegens]
MKIKETHIVPAITEKIRLQEYAVSIFASLPTKSSLKKALKKELILLDGQPAKTSDWIKEGQKIEFLEPEEQNKKVFSLKLEIIFEDEFLAVIHKPAGIPTSGNYFKTVENALAFNLKKSTVKDALPSPLPVHRLDNPTSGILLIAKSKAAQVALNRLFEEKEIQKSYQALVLGTLPTSVTLNDRIEEKEAETSIEVLEHFLLKNENFSLVKAFPKTGRTHQIRIHLSTHGNPIVGDKIYGKTSEFIKKGGLFLAATGLEFQHPVTKENMAFELSLPKKFVEFKRLSKNP